MFNRSLLPALLAALLANMPVQAADTASRDVLDSPALKTPLAQRALLNGLARAGERIVAVGQRGHIVFSDDAGKSWKQADVPLSSDLVAVTFPTATAGWAVGHDGVVLHSTDSGATWSRQLDGRAIGALLVDHYTHAARDAKGGDVKAADALVAEAKRFAAQGADAPLLDVWFADASTGYVVGAFGLILKTVDGGKRWEPALHAVDNPKSLHFYAVRGIAGDVYVAGEQGLLLKLDATTQRFRKLEVPYQGTLFGITGTSSAVIVHGLRGTVLRSVDGGRSWNAVPTGLQVGMTGSAVDAGGRIVIVSQAGHILSSRDSGATFTAVPVERPVPAAAVAMTRDGVVVAGPRGAHALPAR
jgi:photosystem II stability/assembly factor-like uncharacterized protein